MIRSHIPGFVCLVAAGLVPLSLPGQTPLDNSPTPPGFNDAGITETNSTVTFAGRRTDSPTTAISDHLSVRDMLLQPGDVSFRKTPLAEAIFSLSEVWGVNIVAGGEVKGDVSGVFSQAPLAEVLDAILGANGYGYRLSGQSLVIVSLDKIGMDDPNLVSESLAMPGTAEQQESILKAAGLLISPRGQIQALSVNNSLLVVDYRENIERVREFLTQLQTQPGGPSAVAQDQTIQPNRLPAPGSAANAAEAANEESIVYFAPQFVAAEELQGPLTDTLGESVRLSVMATENRLMVLGTPKQLRMAEQIVEQLDRPRMQVRISALIYDVELRRGEELGIDWGNQLSINGMFGGEALDAAAGGAAGGAAAGGAAGGAADGAAAVAMTGAAITLGTLQDTLTLGNVIRALDETRGAQLLADPTITVEDRSEASIKIVTKIPFQQLTQTAEGGNIGTTAFEEAGIVLTVTPRIARDGTIQMKVRPEFSTLVEFVNGQPLIDSRQAETDVRVADRHTLVIGGLRRKQMRDAVSGLPGLMNIRKLGKLFRAHDSGISESELLVFLRPEIISPYHLADPREAAAIDVSEIELNSIPIADLCPLVDDCKDPHCVYHHRRRNVNGGAPTSRPFNGGLIGEFGLDIHADKQPTGIIPYEALGSPNFQSSGLQPTRVESPRAKAPQGQPLRVSQASRSQHSSRRGAVQKARPVELNR
ncbi:secretin N-terminal domain-containing protein [Planctomycetaceae bacterium SH139]